MSILSFFTCVYIVTTIIITYSQQYIYNNASLSKSNHEDTCLFYYDQHLASIHNESQRAEAQVTVASTAWIGISDEAIEDAWIWTDNTPFNYGTTYSTSPWGNNKPDNLNSDEDCVTISSTPGLWNDDGCSKSYSGLCGYPQPYNVINDKSQYVRIRGEGIIIGNIDILDEIYVEFYVTFTSWPAAWGSILHCGDDNNKRYPGIYIEGISQYVQSTFATITNWSPAVNSASGYSLNTEYHYTLYQTQKHLTVTFAGVTVQDADTGVSHAIQMNQTLWLGNNQNDVFDATIRNLKVTTQNSPEDRFWNYICDWSNRWTTNSGGSYEYTEGGSAIDGDCSVRQNNTETGIGRVAWMGVNDPTSLSWTDYKIEFKLNLISGTVVGPIFRANGVNCDPNNCGQYYMLQFKIDKFEFAKMNDVYTQIDAYMITHSYETVYLIRVEAIGNTFKIYEDNVYLTSFTDNSYSSGSVGFRTYQADARISKVRITFPTNQQWYTANPTNTPTQLPTKSPINGCNSAMLLDLVIILDSSGSAYDAGYDKWQAELDFAKGIVNSSLPVQSRVSLINFSGCYNTYTFQRCRDEENRLKKVFGFANYGYNHQAIYDRIDAMDGPNDFNGGFTWINEALNVSLNEFKNHSSAQRNKMIILVTDGYPQPDDGNHEACINSTGYVSKTLTELRALNVSIIGVGVAVTMDETNEYLKCIVEDGTTHFIPCLNFTALVPAIHTIKPLICQPAHLTSKTPTNFPTPSPTIDPTNDPSVDPTTDPTNDPTIDPTYEPTLEPTADPTNDPTTDPTIDPTNDPTTDPTFDPTSLSPTDPIHNSTFSPAISTQQSIWNKELIMWMIIAITMSICAIVIIVIGCKYKKVKNQSKSKVLEINEAENKLSVRQEYLQKLDALATFISSHPELHSVTTIDNTSGAGDNAPVLENSQSTTVTQNTITAEFTKSYKYSHIDTRDHLRDMNDLIEMTQVVERD